MVEAVGDRGGSGQGFGSAELTVVERGGSIRLARGLILIVEAGMVGLLPTFAACSRKVRFGLIGGGASAGRQQKPRPIQPSASEKNVSWIYRSGTWRRYGTVGRWTDRRCNA